MAEDLRPEGPHVTRLRAEIHDLHRLNGRLVALLHGVAGGLKGEPPELTLWDWSDLPQLAAQYRYELELIALDSTDDAAAERARAVLGRYFRDPDADG